ncbi:MAG: hypothetical protein KH061_05535 [Faecalibacterium prausnitzii]|nr:hypothetical protein [Faecalibacterium prausnitzii]
MKLWKKAAAAVLAAVMSLTLLTGCSGSAKITRDSEKEKQATGWIQTYAKEFAEANGVIGFELKADDALVEATSAGAVFYVQASELIKDLPKNPDAWTEADKKKVEDGKALIAKADNAVQQKLAGKKYVTYRMTCNENDFSESMIKTWFDAKKKDMKDDVIKKFDGKLPSGFGVVVEIKSGKVYTIVTIAA